MADDTVKLQALKGWNNKRFEGDVRPGRVFDAPKVRADDLKRRGLAVDYAGGGTGKGRGARRTGAAATAAAAPSRSSRRGRRAAP